MTTDDLIVQQLREMEEKLMNELYKVRLALKAFIDDNIGFGNPTKQKIDTSEQIPRVYASNLTYSSKILYVLHHEGKPMLVDEIVAAIRVLEPGLEHAKLHKNVGHNLSMLAKYANVKKHPFNRKIKYSL